MNPRSLIFDTNGGKPLLAMVRFEPKFVKDRGQFIGGQTGLRLDDSSESFAFLGNDSDRSLARPLRPVTLDAQGEWQWDKTVEAGTVSFCREP